MQTPSAASRDGQDKHDLDQADTSEAARYTLCSAAFLFTAYISLYSPASWMEDAEDDVPAGVPVSTNVIDRTRWFPLSRLF